MLSNVHAWCLMGSLIALYVALLTSAIQRHDARRANDAR